MSETSNRPEGRFDPLRNFSKVSQGYRQNRPSLWAILTINRRPRRVYPVDDGFKSVADKKSRLSRSQPHRRRVIRRRGVKTLAVEGFDPVDGGITASDGIDRRPQGVIDKIDRFAVDCHVDCYRQTLAVVDD